MTKGIFKVDNLMGGMPNNIQAALISHNKDGRSPSYGQGGREAAHLLANAQNALSAGRGIACLCSGVFCEVVIPQCDNGPLL